MPCQPIYIAQVRIADPDRYQDYLQGFMPIFERHGGTLLTVTLKEVAVLEVAWPAGGVVLMVFPDLANPMPGGTIPIT